MSACNASQFLFNNWTQNREYGGEFCVTAGGDFSDDNDGLDEEEDGEDSRPLREKNRRGCHVPHREKPPQIVARRNARERRRVQAVNGAFARLRRAVPIENHRGKRISKVKTLQNAIEYIQNLQELLRKEDYESIDFFTDNKPKIQDHFQVFHRGYYRTPQDEFSGDFGYDLQYRRNSNFLDSI